jgi:hypothetical protein
MHLVAHLALACAAAVGRPYCYVGESVKWQYIEVRHASVDKIGICAIPRFGSGFDSVNGAHKIISGRTKKRTLLPIQAAIHESWELHTESADVDGDLEVR